MKIGLLGAGSVALHHALAAAHLGHQVAAASSLSADSPRWKRFHEAFSDARFVADGHDLFSDESLDAVVSCLPWDRTEEWLDAILASPRPVLMEKPAALSSARLITALENPRPAALKAVAYNRRFYEPVRRLRERLAKGGLKSAEVLISEDISQHEARHPGVMKALEVFSSHTFDLALFLFGPLSAVKVYSHGGGPKDAGFVSRHALLETAAGLPVWLTLNANDPSPVGLRCRFDDATTWHLSPIETLRVYDGYEVQPAQPGVHIRRYLPHVRETVEADARLKPGFVEQMGAFLSGQKADLADIGQSVALLRLIESLRS
ncbi:MAG: hypothetical protein A2V88_03570 [Elusimicrobia bacterium RBG_16_66_12]|nr:MAG: hypothetical protein A2V88_03570 [Elusimicrobia bacterium RBG_16_66_12]